MKMQIRPIPSILLPADVHGKNLINSALLSNDVVFTTHLLSSALATIDLIFLILCLSVQDEKGLTGSVCVCGISIASDLRAVHIELTEMV